MERVWRRHGERLCAHILSPEERDEFAAVKDPAGWPSAGRRGSFFQGGGNGDAGAAEVAGISVIHMRWAGRASRSAPFIQAWLHRRGIDHAHLSISDEREIACAFVIWSTKRAGMHCRRNAPGPVVLDLSGQRLSAADRDRLLHPLVAGVIHFFAHYEAPGRSAR